MGKTFKDNRNRNKDVRVKNNSRIKILKKIEKVNKKEIVSGNFRMLNIPEFLDDIS